MNTSLQGHFQICTSVPFHLLRSVPTQKIPQKGT